MNRDIILVLVAIVSGTAATVLSLFANSETWFRVPDAPGNPTIGLWEICRSNLRDCQAVGNEGNHQYDIYLGVMVSRILIILATIFGIAYLFIVLSMAVGFTKLDFPALPAVFGGIMAFVMLLGCLCFELAVRLQVIQEASQSVTLNQSFVDTETGWAGICAWTSFAACVLSTVIGIVIFFTRDV